MAESLFNTAASLHILCDLVPFVQFKKQEKHPWKSVLLKVTLLNGCFSRFLKLCKW